MTAQKIDRLTPEQEARLPQICDEWIAHGLSTEPANRAEAERGVRLAYQIAGLKAPNNLIWVSSPLEGEKMVRSMGLVSRPIYGQHDAAWLAFYNALDFLDCVKQLEGLMIVGKNAGWWWPFEDRVIISDRPSLIRFDDRKLLHCEDGPAVKYRDGFSVYSWHGTAIPKEWIENRSELDPMIALNWPNTEQRRCAAEIIGWDTVLNRLNCRVINADADPEIGTLVEVDIPEIGKERFLRVRCGTGRQFALPVPPTMRTALEAQAWTWGMDANDFTRPEVRT